jgi:starvation-inducible DNA-binding protein
MAKTTRARTTNGTRLKKGAIAISTKNDLPLATREAMVGILNQSLADLSDLASQVRHAHWNVKGANFIALHELFDKLYADVAEYVDLVAERSVQLGGIAVGTVRIAAERSSLPQYPLDILESADHIEALSAVVSAAAKSVRARIDAATEAGDANTADIFTEVSRGLDKWLWFIEAHDAGPIHG